MFSIGEYVYDSIKKERVQILEINDVWGFVSYKVFNASTGAIYRVSAEFLSNASEESQDENYLRYVALLAKIKNETSEGILFSGKKSGQRF